MKDAGEAMAGLARPMQHALNNLIMVVQANMDSVLASLPPEDRAAVRLSRAAQAMREIDTLARGFLRLGRPEEAGETDSGKLVNGLRPLMAVAISRPVIIEVVATASVAPRRPALDLAMLGAMAGARALPRNITATLRLDGLAMALNWALDPACLPDLAEAGITVVEATPDGARLLLPGG